LHVSPAGTRAEHAEKPPLAGSQVWVPAQVPNALASVHARDLPLSPAVRHAHEPVSGTHTRRVDPAGPMAVQEKPAAQTPSGRPFRLPGPQSSAHALPPSSGTHAFPGTTQFASAVHGEQPVWMTGRHVVELAW